MEEIPELLQILKDSCMEGYLRTWDTSGDGREGFLDMITIIEEIEDKLKI